MFKKLLILLGFTLLLAGCGSSEETAVVEDFKKAVLDEDSEALINMAEMSMTDLTEEEAEGYFALIKDNYSEEEFEEAIDAIIDDFKDDANSSSLSSTKGERYEIASFQTRNGELQVHIPRYSVTAEFPPGIYTIQYGPLEVQEWTDTTKRIHIGKIAPGITEYKATAEVRNEDKEFPYTLKINFNNPEDDRVIVEL